MKEKLLALLGMKDRLTIEQCLQMGKWGWAKKKARTVEDFVALAEHHLDPLGKDRRGVGDQSSTELSRAVVPVARRFAEEAGASQEVIEALREK